MKNVSAFFIYQRLLEIYQAMKQMTNIHEGRQRVKLNSDVKSFLSRSQNFSPKRKTGKAERPAFPSIHGRRLCFNRVSFKSTMYDPSLSPFIATHQKLIPFLNLVPHRLDQMSKDIAPYLYTFLVVWHCMRGICQYRVVL